MMKYILKYAALTVLFLTAVSATFTFITNMTFTDVKTFLNERTYSGSEVSGASYVNRDIAIESKEKQQDEAVEPKEAVKDLEQAIDLSQYPSDTVVATGYTAGVESTGKTADHPEYGITYSGLEVRRDLYSTIAADLSVYPLGTILFIPDYGYGVVADKGGAIKGNRIDLYYPTVEDVYEQWGKKEVDVYVIKKGDGQLKEADLKTLNNKETLQVFRENMTSP